MGASVDQETARAEQGGTAVFEATPRQHWNSVYVRGGPTRVSWYQAEPAVSLELVEALKLPLEGAILDIGGGASNLADALNAAPGSPRERSPFS